MLLDSIYIYIYLAFTTTPSSRPVAKSHILQFNLFASFFTVHILSQKWSPLVSRCRQKGITRDIQDLVIVLRKPVSLFLLMSLRHCSHAHIFPPVVVLDYILYASISSDSCLPFKASASFLFWVPSPFVGVILLYFQEKKCFPLCLI